MAKMNEANAAALPIMFLVFMLWAFGFIHHKKQDAKLDAICEALVECVIE